MGASRTFGSWSTLRTWLLVTACVLLAALPCSAEDSEARAPSPVADAVTDTAEETGANEDPGTEEVAAGGTDEETGADEEAAEKTGTEEETDADDDPGTDPVPDTDANAEAEADASSPTPKAAPVSCDSADPACAPCDEDKEQFACCNPETSPLCIDMGPKFLGVPVPGYSPQVKFSLGLIGMATYHVNKADKVSPPSSTVLFGMVTTNKSWVAAIKQEFYWGQDNHRARAAVATGSFNAEFYGTGGTTESGVSLPLGSTVALFQPDYMYRVWNRIYLGLRYRVLWNEAVLSPPKGGEAPPSFVPITSKLLHSGLGIVGEYDTRDNRFSATEGFYIPVESIYNAKVLGGDANFGDLSIATNYYHSWLNRKLILASRVYAQAATDGTPSHLKPAVGKGPDLRGYAYGRYRDNLFLAAQVEARWYFWWKLGAAAFGGIGTTTSGLDQLHKGTVLPSYGIGLRMLAFEAQRLVIRLDYARGNEDGQFYFSISEAF